MPIHIMNERYLPIFREVIKHIDRGGYALGICNGFQIFTEAGVLPGILQRNKGTKFISKVIDLRVTNTSSTFTHNYSYNSIISICLNFWINWT